MKGKIRRNIQRRKRETATLTGMNFTRSQHQQTFTGKTNRGGGVGKELRYDRLTVVSVRLFVDMRNGEPIPRKSILKSRSRENSVCSDTSESSAAEFEERRMIGRGFSHDEATHSDTSDGITEEDSPTAVPLQPASRFEVRTRTLALT